MKKTMCLASLAFCLSTLTLTSLLSLPPSARILGLIISPEVEVDGVKVPSGTTLLDEALVESGADPAVIHLNAGGVVQLDRNSSASFERTPAGDIEIAVESGTITLSTAGGVWTIDSKHFVVVPEKEQGKPVALNGSVVAVLTGPAAAGDRQLQVNDASKIDPAFPILVTSRTGGAQEMHEIRGTEGHTLQLVRTLENSFESLALISQGDEAAAAGEATPSAASGGQVDWQTIGIVAGAAAGGTAIIIPAVKKDEEASPSPIRP